MTDDKLICCHWTRCPHFDCRHHWPHYADAACIQDRTCEYTDEHHAEHAHRRQAYCDWPDLMMAEHEGSWT